MKNIQKHKFRSFITLILMVAFGAYLIQGFYAPLTVTEYIYHNDKIPEDFSGYTIVQLSDLHCKNFGDNQSQLIEAITECKPDIIVLTGDFVDADHTDIQPVIDLIEGIHTLAPIYFITGNHDLVPEARPQYLKMLDVFEQYGVIDLDDDKVTLRKGDSFIRLYGRKYLSKYLTISLPIASEVYFDILLYHGNDNFDAIAPYHYDLVLSGHSHGGVVQLPFVGGLIGNDRNFFPKYDKGMFTSGDSTLIVSGGLGNNLMPRFNNPPEITVIKLVP